MPLAMSFWFQRLWQGPRRRWRPLATRPAVAPACAEALPLRVLLSVDPAMAGRLLDHGYEKITWKGHESYAQPGQWIVSLRGVRGDEGTQIANAAARVRKAAPRAALRVADRLGRDGLFRVDAPAGSRFKDVRAALGRVPGVEFAEPNFAVWAQGVESGAQAVVTPDDPHNRFQWGLNNPGGATGTADADIDAPEAWALTTGAGDIVVGVIDTGVDYNHPDLVDNMWVNPGETGVDDDGNDKASNGIDDDGNGYADDVHGYDFVDLDAEPLDDHNHGTHVAGILAASGDNAAGVTGMALNA